MRMLQAFKSNSAYCDLVRLTGHDPTAEISSLFKEGEAE